MPGPSLFRDHYTVLGVEPSATSRQITTAYRRQIRALHPDSGQSWEARCEGRACVRALSGYTSFRRRPRTPRIR
ncbi:J domain-containing protein [Streptomyces sp. Tu 2975]|nr:J domain-containing protein [Streptomyces sp. Tu 2975]